MVSGIDHDTDSSGEYMAILTMKQSVSKVYLGEKYSITHADEDQPEGRRMILRKIKLFEKCPCPVTKQEYN